MSKFRLCASVVSVFVLTTAIASAAMVRSSAVSVLRVNVETDPTGSSGGEVYLVFNTSPHSTSCSSATTQWAVAGDPESVKLIHATALSAKLSGAQVKVLFNNSYSGTQSCTGGGTSGSPLVRGLEIQ